MALTTGQLAVCGQHHRLLRRQPGQDHRQRRARTLERPRHGQCMKPIVENLGQFLTNYGSTRFCHFLLYFYLVQNYLKKLLLGYVFDFLSGENLEKVYNPVTFEVKEKKHLFWNPEFVSIL
jgi:hypothetical protein